MPGTRTRKSAATEEEAPEIEEIEEEDDGARHLQFNETLTWRAGKAIPVAELLRRLQALNGEIRDIDQDDADRNSLVPVAKELATQNLLGHKDRGVRAWTACALVDMFRLCAPDAPYTPSQLKDIFTLFVVTILPALADPSNPYNAQHQYVLKSLAEVKSVVLLADLSGASNLIIQMFTTCFDVLSGPSKSIAGEELSKNIEHHMTVMLAALADEADMLPTEVVEVILAQFLRADPRATGLTGSKNKKSDAIEENQSTFLLKEAPPAYNMAKNICNNSMERMAQYITQYFSTVIADSSARPTSKTPHKKSHKRASTPQDSDDDLPQTRSEEDLKETSKAHRMLRELWRATPNVLDSIIPQLDVELTTEDTDIRLLATETIGDMISGIGAAGPPPIGTLIPTAYPSQSLIPEVPRSYNFLTTPTSLLSFPSRHSSIYHSFLQRKKDKSPLIRAAVATGIGRVLMTSAGGVGLDSEEEKKLLGLFSDLLVDQDEKVRLAVVKAIERFEFWDIVQRLGSQGGLSEPNSVLHNLGQRTKDPKPNIRAEATRLLGKIWGVAAGAISEGQERMVDLFGAIPSRIFDALYVNDPDINTFVLRVLHESLLPISYPPIKPKATTAQNGSSQKIKEGKKGSEQEFSEADIDRIRVERELILIRSLEPKAKAVLVARQGQQVQMAKLMELFLKSCESYNGGVMENNEKETKVKLGKLIEHYSRTISESSKASDALWKFAKSHDRRIYQLIRFAIAAESDYRKVYRSIKEMSKRLEDANHTYILEVILPLIFQSSSLLYNRSHLPSIIEFSRSNEKDLGDTAHEVLKEISDKHPEIFKAHVKELCKVLENDAPSAKNPNGPGAVQDLKACAGFARKFPQELPKDRKFLQSMVNFALYGKPAKAAKHAITILMAVSDKKEMHARDVAQKCIKDFVYGSEHCLSRLASLSQLALIGPKEIEGEVDDMMVVAIDKVLMIEPPKPTTEDPAWTEEPDDGCAARIWGLKILVNRIRSHPDINTIKDISNPLYRFLNNTLENGGEIKKTFKSPEAHKARMRLTAAHFLLKLSCVRRLDVLLDHQAFNQLSTVAQDTNAKVRTGFVNKLMKYLGLQKLPSRFYAILFLLQFEPEPSLQHVTVTWIRSRCQQLQRQRDTTMEALFSRFLSLLAHHPDFSTEARDLQDFVRYIMFYLKTVSTQENLGLIYHVAQRVKAVQDGIDPTKGQNLYVLSDLAQLTIRTYQDIQGWSMQAWPGKVKMPGGIFAALAGHNTAQEVATKQYVPEEVVDEIESVVKDCLRTKKRKLDHPHGEHTRQKKRTKSGAAGTSSKSLPIRKPARTPRVKKIRESSVSEMPSSERRRSGRGAAHKSYVEHSDDDDDDDMELGDRGVTEKDDDEELEAKSDDEEMSDVPGGRSDDEKDQEESDVEEEDEVEKLPPKKKRKESVASKSNGVKKLPAKSSRASKEKAAPTPSRRSRRSLKRNDRADSSDLSEAPDSE